MFRHYTVVELIHVLSGRTFTMFKKWLEDLRIGERYLCVCELIL